MELNKYMKVHFTFVNNEPICKSVATFAPKQVSKDVNNVSCSHCKRALKAITFQYGTLEHAVIEQERAALELNPDLGTQTWLN